MLVYFAVLSCGQVEPVALACCKSDSVNATGLICCCIEPVVAAFASQSLTCVPSAPACRPGIVMRSCSFKPEELPYSLIMWTCLHWLGHFYSVDCCFVSLLCLQARWCCSDLAKPEIHSVALIKKSLSTGNVLVNGRVNLSRFTLHALLHLLCERLLVLWHLCKRLLDDGSLESLASKTTRT